MKSLAPARSGLFPDRLAPRLSAPLIALLIAGCASVPAGSDSGPTSGAPARPAASSSSSGPATAAEQPAERPPRRAERASANSEDEDEPADALPEVQLTSQLMFQLLASEIAAQRGEIGSATATYLSMARQTRDPRLARRATELALGERSLDRALPAAQLWHELAPNSSLAAQTLETLLLSSGRLPEAEPLLRARLERARAEDRVADVYPQVQRTLARVPDHAAALALLDRVSAPDAKLPQAKLALAALASAAGDDERAAREATAALALAPDDESTAVTAARYVARSARGADGAIRLLQDFLARQPKAIEVRFALGRLLASEERYDAAREEFELALKQEPDNPTILFSLAQIAWQNKQPKVAEEYLQRYVDLPPTVQRDNGAAWLFLGQIAENDGRPEEAIARYANVHSGEQFMPALVRRALLISRQGRLDEARQLLQGTSVTTNRERVQLISAEAQVLREAKRNDEAADLLGKALERLPENPELLYDHAMAAERIDRLDLMEASLRKLIALRPDHAHAYNALGYTFADRNIRLDEAQQLIEKALSLRPDDAHIMDSMGWVLYRRGDLPGALAYLRKAWATSQEAEIAVHLGEVLWKTGQADEARKFWREARRLEPDNAVLRETLARLAVTL